MKGKEDELARQLIEVIPRTMWSLRNGLRSAAESEFTVPQFRILARLFQAPATNGELAEAIGISVPAASRMVDALVKRGLLSRTQRTADRRQVALNLSPVGRRKFMSVRNAAQSRFSIQIASLDPLRRQALADGLDVLQEVFE